jgi:hypothetical protein
MAYLGNSPLVGQYRKMDSIVSQFNGNLTSFNITVGGVAFTPPSAYAVIISLNNVILNPGVGFSISGSVISFPTPPAALTPFFGLILGDTLYTGTPSDNTVINSKIADGAISYDKFDTNTQARLTANQIIFGV